MALRMHRQHIDDEFPSCAPQAVREAECAQAIERSLLRGRAVGHCHAGISIEHHPRDVLPPLTLHRRVAGARHAGLRLLAGAGGGGRGLGVGVVLAIEVELLLELGGGDAAAPGVLVAGEERGGDAGT